MPDLAKAPDEEARLLLCAALGSADGAQTAWELLRHRLDIETISYETHGLFPQLAQSLRTIDESSDLLPRLDGVARRTWSNNSVRVRGVLDVRRMLGREQVVAEPTGGLALLLRGPNLAWRPLVDAELVVDADDVPLAEGALLSEGWSTVAQHRDGWLGDLHRAVFARAARTVTLRWTDGAWPYGTAKEAVEVPTLGTSVNLPSATDLLCYALIEGYELWGYPPTRRYADLMMLATRLDSIEWSAVVDLARHRNAALQAAAALTVLSGQLGCSVPPWVLADLAREPNTWRLRAAARLERRSRSLTAALRSTAHLSPRAAVVQMPTLLRRLWGTDPRARLPVEMVRRVARRLGVGIAPR